MKTRKSMTGEKTRSLRSQSFVFFAISAITLLMFCGLGMDAGLIFIAQARLSRACDAAVLAAGRNLSLPQSTLASMAQSIAIANDPDLAGATTVTGPITIANGTQYIYSDATGSTGATITVSFTTVNGLFTANCNASVKKRTNFMAVTGINAVTNFTLNDGAQAQAAKPRIVVVIADRSGGMFDNGGALDMEKGLTNFFGKFSTNTDKLGFYTYGNFARREFPITNNFWTLGTNKCSCPGSSANALQGINPLDTNKIRYGGGNAAEDALRMAAEDIKAYPSYSTYNVYVVFFCGSTFDCFRSLFYTPAYTNVVFGPPSSGVFTTDGTELDVPISGAHVIGTGMSNLALTFSTNMSASTNSSGAFMTNISVALYPGCTNIYYADTINHGNGSITGYGNNVTTTTFILTQTAGTGGSRTWDDIQDVFINMMQGESNVFIAPGYTNLDAIINGTSTPPSYQSILGNGLLPASGGQASDYPANGNNKKAGLSTQTNAWADDSCNYTNILSDFVISSPNDLSYPSTTDPHTYPAMAFFFTRSDVIPKEPFGGSLSQYNTITEAGVGGTQGVCYVSTNMNRVAAPGVPSAYLFITNGGTFSTPWTGYTNLAKTNYVGLSYARPTAYYSFKSNAWVPITNFTDGSKQIQPEASWMVGNYATRMRADLGATIYSIDLNNSSDPPDSATIQAMANQVGSPTYTSSQPSGQYYHVINSNKLMNAFTIIANQINQLTLTK